MDSAVLRKPLKYGQNFLLVRYVTFMSGSFTPSVQEFLNCLLRLVRLDIQNTHARTIRRKKVGYCSTDAARTARNDDRFTVEAKPIRILAGIVQRETPLFHGMKSFWPSISALVWTWPLATSITLSRMASPICSIVTSPSMMGPVSKSTISAIRRAKVELVEIFTTGATGFPVGVPSPVVKSTTLAPAATWAVTHSTSFPGVHCKFSPGSVEYS